MPHLHSGSTKEDSTGTLALENYLLSDCRSKRVSEGSPEGGLSRRRFLSMGGMLTAGALLQGGRFAAASTKPDIVLHIVPGEIEVAAGHIIHTVTYNGSAPGPLLVIPEGKSTRIEIHNESSNREYIHWHGFSLDAALD